VRAQILLSFCCVRSCLKIFHGLCSHAAGLGSYSSGILLLLYVGLFWGEVPVGLAWLGGLLIEAGGLLLVKSRCRLSEPALRSGNTRHRLNLPRKSASK
jgi:hypothetical protein